MATASPGTDTLAVARWGDGEDGSKSDRYLAERLAAAGADVKGVAVATFVLASAVAALLWLAVGVAADHWLFIGGVPAWARWCWLGAGIVALAAAIVRWIVPLVRYRVNLVFAARAIERDYPELHNDLVNTVLVKARPDATVAPVVRSLERRAAKRLSHVPTDGVIDRTTTLRLALALAALVVAATLYGLLAPKSLLTTAARLMAPWARITPPTRVSIDPPRLAWRRPGEPPAEANHPTREIEAVDGVVRVVRGRQLVVSTTVHGLRGDERPTLVVRPAEGGDRGWDAVMAAGTAGPGGQERHVAVLPDDARGLDDPLDVVIAAGDARSEPLRIAVVDTPSLLVREVRYEYPAYTARATETVAWQGDLRAVEGTTVALVAEGNGPLEAAWVDFDCDGTNDLELTVGRQDPLRATGRFRLRLDADRARPWHDSYRLVFVPRGSGGTRADQVTEQLEHRIDVLPDLAPEVTIESPREPVVVVPPDAPVAIAVRALDPDFGLARVAVELRLKGEPPLPARALLDQPRGGPFRGVTRLVPRDVGAGPGTVIEYRAVAIDTRPEEPNVAASRWQTLRIDASAPPARQPDVPPPDAERPRDEGPRGDARPMERPADAPRRDDGKDDAAPSDEQPGAPRKGDGAKDGSEPPQDGTASREPGGPRQPGVEPGDPKPPTGEAGRGDPSPGQPGADAAGDPKNGGGQEPGGASPDAGGGRGGAEQPQRGEGQVQPTDQASGKDTGAGDTPRDRGGERGGAATTGERGQAGERGEQRGALPADGTNDGEAMERILEHKKQEERDRNGEPDAGRERPAGHDGDAGDAPQPEGQPGEGQPGEGKPGEGKPGEGKPGEGKPGEGKPGEGKPGEGRPGEGKPGEGRPGEGKPGEGKPGEGKPGEGKPGEGKPGEGKPGEGKPGEGKPGEGKPGEGKPGEGKPGEGQPGEGKPGEGKPGEGKPGEGQPGEGKPGEGKPGEGKPGEGKPGEGKPGEGKPGEGRPGEGKPGEGKPGEGKPSEGKPGEGKPGEGKPGEGKPGEGQPGEGRPGEGKPGEGKPGEGKPGEGKPGEVRPGEGQPGEGKPGEGQPGEGQPGEGKPGEGKPGEGKPGEGQPGEGQPGEGQPGEGRPGEGRPGEGRPGEGKPGEGKPGEGQPGEGKPGEGQPGEGKPGEGQGTAPGGKEPAGSSVGAGGTTGGDRGEGAPPAADDAAPERREMEWTDTDLSHARNAADLALEHLRNNLAAGRTDVLDRLGWTPEQARAFLERWQEMRRLADSPDPRQRGEFERTLRSLGLRPAGVRSSRDAPSDTKGGQAEGRRSRPPSSYREQFEAYLRGTAGE